MSTAVKKIFFALFCCLLVNHCAYRLRGTGSFLPSHIKKMNIPMFKNLTTRFELDVKLTNKVIDEIVARGKVGITGDMTSADAVLLGEITSFSVTPIAFSKQASADRYNITIVASITLRDLVNQKVVFSNPHFVYQGEYDVPQGTDFESVESEALDSIAEKFAKSLISTILEGF
jgi:hypothetical protein